MWVTLLSSVWLTFCAIAAARGATWYVDDSVSSPGNGESWDAAFKTIQEGIDAASDGDTVVVAEGTYVENIVFSGKNIVLCSQDRLNADTVKNTIIDGNESGPVVKFAGTEDDTCLLAGFTIQGGKADEGGGICGGYEGAGTHATIINNIIIRNSATVGGAGLFRCDGVIRNNTITENSARYDGGGLCMCAGTIQNNAITANSAGHGSGGGLYDCFGTIENNTVTGNSASSGGGLYGCDAVILNCIIWGNTASRVDPQLCSSRTPSYSCVEGWTEGGEGNTAEDPKFADADGPDDIPDTYEDNDYRLSDGSPCIDTGKNEDWMDGAVDLDGNPRILFGVSSATVDMGAYEYNPFQFKITQVSKVAGDGAHLTWTSRPGDTYTIWSSTDLTAPTWAEEATLASQGTSTSWTDPPSAAPCTFYRIQLK